MKTYQFFGTDSTLSDEHGEIRLNKHDEMVHLDSARAEAWIASGAPLKEVTVEDIPQKETE